MLSAPISTAIANPSRLISGGNFALAGVPTGDVQLKFSGSGAEATVPVAEVQPAQSITLQVAFSGANASVETELSAPRRSETDKL